LDQRPGVADGLPIPTSMRKTIIMTIAAAALTAG
jgi:hypothetical protein